MLRMAKNEYLCKSDSVESRSGFALGHEHNSIINMNDMHKKYLVTLLAGIFALNLSAQEQLSFPGAYGWGRFAQGGRYGKVYHVTNLNDSGAGSLRDAVSQPNRIVVFDVAGVINISSRMTFAKNLYVAGQTAPGEGVTLYGDGVSFSGANNLICRYLRVRMGHGGTKDKDCAGVANGTNMIFDHCSFAWGLDETFSINSDGKGALGDITIQNCIIGQGLMPHSAGGLIQTDNVTLYRNFYCDNSTRNNKVKGKNQYANNIVYNWNNAAYIMGGDSEGQSFCNIQGNLFINGPSGGGAAFTGGNGNFHFYGDDNWQDRTVDGKFAPQLVADYSASDRQQTPYAYPQLDVVSGKDLLTLVLPTVGASLPYRDMTDCYMIDEVMSYGKKGDLISNEGILPYGVPSSWKVFKGNGRKDTDGDGMPDWWEEKHGTNVALDDAMQIAENGYANIENYINSLTQEDSEFYLRQPMIPALASSTTNTLNITWADYTQGEDGFAIESKGEDGTWKEILRTAANANSQRISNLEPGTAYEIRLRAFAEKDGEELYSAYSAPLSVKTRPEEVGIINIDTFEPDLTWSPLIKEWTDGTEGWKEGGSWDNESQSGVLFPVEEESTVSIPSAVTPASVVVKGHGKLTFTGAGGIGGSTTSVNKSGEGSLVLNTLNDYQGATVLHEGVLEFNTLKNGGEPSAIGASQEFAQNWIMDGGVYRYSGGSTQTNRSATLTKPTTLEISKQGAVVQMNGSIEGTSDFTLDGSGKLQVASPSFFKYSGATILKGGELFLSTIEASKGGVGSSNGVIMAGGMLSTKGENEAYETYSFPIQVVGGTTSVLAPHRNCYISSTLTGEGTLQINIPYVREYIKGNWSNFKGVIVAQANAAGNLFLAEKSFNMPKAVVRLKNGARACNWETNGNAYLGGLSGDGGTQLCGSSKQQNGFTCTWHIGSANSDEVFAGSINNFSCSGSGHQGTVSIEKVGTGYWRLTGQNEYSGTTIVTAGRLIVNGVNSGAGTYTVASGATLSGQGTIAANVTMKKGAILQPGDSVISNKKLTLQGTTTMQAGSILRIMARTSTTSTTINSNPVDATKLSLGTGATLEIDLTNVPDSLPNDKSIRVFSTATTVTGKFKQIAPERPSETQVWDDSQLYTKGLLYVRDAGEETAIHSSKVTSAGKVAYSLNGTVATSTTKGMQIIQNEDGTTKKIVRK